MNALTLALWTLLAGLPLTAPPVAAASLTGAPPAGAPEGRGECRGTEVVERTTQQMGTLLTIRASGVARACGLAALDAAIEEVARVEAVLSSWSEASDVGRLNASPPGVAWPISAELDSLLTEAGRWVERTGGAFDPGVGALVDAWDLRGAGRIPSADSLGAARRASGWDQLRRPGPGLIERSVESWWLDSGGFGKGAALDAAAAVLARQGVTHAALDFGGQVMVLGGPEDVAVADPSARTREVVRLRLEGASVATTSLSERFVEVDGERLGHVLDPRTGVPAREWGSVSVVMRNALAADALSTALYVMGPDAALEWAAERDDVGVLVLRLDGGTVRAEWNRAMSDLVVRAPDGEPTAGRSSFTGSDTTEGETRK